MNFINPFLLLFAAAAAVPLLLHLFNRQRVKVVEFSTVKYLVNLQKTRMRKVKIRQILLLILRTLALLAIAFAFSRPTTEGGYLPSLGGKTTTTAVLLIDISGSSMTETNAGSFFEKSIDKANQILNNFTEKEKVTIIGFGSTILYDTGEPTSDFDKLKSVLKAMQPSQSEADPKAAFVKAHDILKSVSDPNKELYLISDFQGEAWKNFEYGIFLAEKMDVKLFVTKTSLKSVENVAVESIRFPNQIITAGREFSLQADIKNYKSDASADVLASLEVGDKKVAQNNVPIASSASGKVAFNYSAGKSGFLYGSVTIDDDDLLGDNKYFFGMRIPSSSNILLISEDDEEAFHIQKALSPAEGANFSKQITLEGALQASTANLFSYDAVIVNLKGQIPPALSSGLRSYLNTGGAVLFLMRPNADLKDFSERVSSPLFGLNVVEAPSQPKPEAGKYLLNKFDFDHPLFMPYKQIAADKLPQAEFLGHAKTIETANSKVLARFSDNSPAILEGQIGKGKTLMYAFSLDSKYSDLTERPFMVILLNRSLEYLVAEPLNQRETIYAGNEVTRELGAQSAKQFALVGPDNDSTALSPAYRTGEAIFSLGRVRRTGIYRIVGDGTVVDVFAVNFPQKESETFYAQPDDVGKKVAGAKVIILDYASDPAKSIASARYGTELWKLFLLLGFLFLMIEMAVAYGGGRPEVSTG